MFDRTLPIVSSLVVFLAALFTVSERPVSAQTVDWSTTINGSSIDIAYATRERSDGTIVIAGTTSSSNFPAPPGTPPASGGGNDDAFVACFDPSLSGAAQLLWTTFLGGDDLDVAYELRITSDDRVWVTGYTESSDFPVTVGAPQSNRNGASDAFVARLDVDGGIEFSTYFGGSGIDAGAGLALENDEVWFAGVTSSPDLPTVTGAVQNSLAGGFDLFLARLGFAGSLTQVTYLGGSADESLVPSSVPGQSFELDRISLDRASDGRLAIVTSSLSADFPLVASGSPPSSGLRDGVVAVIDPLFSGVPGLVWSTYFGGTADDQPFEVRWLDDGTLAVAGTTVSTNLPLTAGAFQSTYGGGDFDGFVARFDPSESGASALLYSSYFGGSGDDSIVGMSIVEGTRVATVGNSTASVPTTTDAWIPTHLAGFGFSGRLQIFDFAESGGDSLEFSTFLGQSGGSIAWGVDAAPDRVTVVGWSAGDDYPALNPFMTDTDFIGAVATSATLPTTPIGAAFTRGDVNGDGGIDIADPIQGLQILFAGGASLCNDAEDANDDGTVDIADMVFLLNVLFVPLTPALPEPSDCDVDPSADALRCQVPTC
ncbi:MAG: hypothetical protein AAF488_08920 [Planctomycetota bacterium]